MLPLCPKAPAANVIGTWDLAPPKARAPLRAAGPKKWGLGIVHNFLSVLSFFQKIPFNMVRAPCAVC